MLLLVPGYGVNTRIFTNLKKQLEIWQIPTIDLNYDDNNIELSFLKNFESLPKNINYSKTYVIAWSLGANLILKIMAKLRINFKKVILVSSGINVLQYSRLLQKPSTNKDFKKLISNAITTKVDINKDDTTELNILKHSIRHPVDINPLIDYLKQYNINPVPKGNFTIIHGLEDKIVNINSAQALRNLLLKENSVVNFYALTCGHIPFIEDSQNFKEILEHELF